MLCIYPSYMPHRIRVTFFFGAPIIQGRNVRYWQQQQYVHVKKGMMIGGMGSRQGVRIDERAVFKWTLHTKIGWTAQLYVVADEEITARNTKYR